MPYSTWPLVGLMRMEVGNDVARWTYLELLLKDSNRYSRKEAARRPNAKFIQGMHIK
jgi:hypothetical protein